MTMAVIIMFFISYDVVPLEGRWPEMSGEKTRVVLAFGSTIMNFRWM